MTERIEYGPWLSGGIGTEQRWVTFDGWMRTEVRAAQPTAVPPVTDDILPNR